MTNDLTRFEFESSEGIPPRELAAFFGQEVLSTDLGAKTFKILDRDQAGCSTCNFWRLP